MTKSMLAGALLILIVGAGALAQEPTGQKQATSQRIVSRTIAGQPLRSEGLTPRLRWREDLSQESSSSVESPQSSSQVLSAGPFVFFEGAIYQVIPLVDRYFLGPMSGGGASGCFSSNGVARVVWLKELPELQKSEPKR